MPAFLVGPFTPGFVANRAITEQFAEIGVHSVILLLFGIGLRFHLSEMIAMWRIVVPGALIQSTMSTGALAVILHFMGWSWSAGLILGMAVSVASTVVMALVLAEWHDLHAQIGYIAKSLQTEIIIQRFIASGGCVLATSPARIAWCAESSRRLANVADRRKQSRPPGDDAPRYSEVR